MEKYSAMIQLIHSDLDADNLDYLLRDAMHLCRNEFNSNSLYKAFVRDYNAIKDKSGKELSVKIVKKF